jgi:hypothetical protein
VAGALEVDVVEFAVVVTEVGAVELEAGKLDTGTEDENGVVAAVLVFPGVASGDLQAAGSDAMAIPAAATTACFRNCRRENLVTRSVCLFPRISFPSSSGILPSLSHQAMSR